MSKHAANSEAIECPLLDKMCNINHHNMLAGVSSKASLHFNF